MYAVSACLAVGACLLFVMARNKSRSLRARRHMYTAALIFVFAAVLLVVTGVVVARKSGRAGTQARIPASGTLRSTTRIKPGSCGPEAGKSTPSREESWPPPLRPGEALAPSPTVSHSDMSSPGLIPDVLFSFGTPPLDGEAFLP
jgi:hypothetical protein